MPTERFLRLSDEKKKVIIEAARIEFSRVSIDRVSINRIIADAGISRGSFYTYFEDKWDLLKYMIESTVCKVHNTICESMKANGDLWEAMESGLFAVMEYGKASENMDFIKNTILHLSPEEMNQSVTSHNRFMCKENDEFIMRLYESYNKDLYREMSQKEFKYACEFIFTNLVFSLKEYFEGKDRDEVIQEFRDKCGIIKYGINVR